jgi:hypothetical protein
LETACLRSQPTHHQGAITESGSEEQGEEGGNVDGQINLAEAVCDIASTAMPEHRRRHSQDRANKVVRRERLMAIEITGDEVRERERIKSDAITSRRNRNLPQIGPPDLILKI